MLVTPASTIDRAAARMLLPAAKKHVSRLARVWADGSYTGHLAELRDVTDSETLDVLPRELLIRFTPIE
ncbi:hypothetical protein [Streptomyces aureus]|uniref:hypothetical protein n=1 Tax=Streptomyces aureus TaxID=193461 RepID=UPI0033CE4696